MSVAPYLWLGGRRRGAQHIPANVFLYLNSNLGLSGADGSNVTSWPDQSGNGYNATDTGTAVHPTLQKTTGVQTPNGKQTVRFYGQDFPNQCILGNASPNPYPSITNGWTFYFGYYMLNPVSSSSLQMLWDENSGGLMRYVPEDSGTVYGYRDQVGEKLSSTTSILNAWQSNRWVFKTDNTVDIFVNGTSVTWPGAHTWSLAAAMQGYTLGNLLANEVTGLNAYVAWVLWYTVAHTAAQQKTEDNFLRGYFGLPLI